MAANEYAERARQRKVAGVVSYTRAKGITSTALSAMTPEERSAHVAAAGEKSASEESWKMILNTVQFLEKREAAHPDPFEGF
jgi:hypothetical protein